MKVLFITNYFYPEPFRNNELVTELVRRGHNVTVLTSYPSYPYGKIYGGYGFDITYEDNYNGAKIVRLKSAPRGKTPIGLLNNCISFVKCGKKWVGECSDKYDIVYFPALSPSTSGLVAKYYKDKFPDTKMIIHIQDLWPESVEEVLHVKFNPLSNLIRKIMDQVYTSSDYILCSSKSYVEYLKNWNKNIEDKLFFWPQFYIDQNEYNVPIEYTNLNKDTLKITFTGNIGFAQGLDLLIETAKFINDNHKEINIKWFLVGDGRAKEKLINQVKKYHLENTIVFTGKKSLSEANNFSHYADLSYLSFKNEFFNMTIPAKLQGYLACKSPILCVVGGESAMIVEKNKCGFVSEKNPESIYKKILEYISLDDNEKFLIRENSYKCYHNNFTIIKVVDELEKYMEK